MASHLEMRSSIQILRVIILNEHTLGELARPCHFGFSAGARATEADSTLALPWGRAAGNCGGASGQCMTYSGLQILKREK